MDAELYAIYQQDQADRNKGFLLSLQRRDRERLIRVMQILATAENLDASDYFHTAVIFQHGEEPDHYLKAYEYAKRSAELGYEEARFLTAAAYDRWLLSLGKPQKYGTQYVSIGGQSFILHEFDPTTTDKERAMWNVPPLAEILQRMVPTAVQKENE